MSSPPYRAAAPSRAVEKKIPPPLMPPHSSSLEFESTEQNEDPMFTPLQSPIPQEESSIPFPAPTSETSSQSSLSAELREEPIVYNLQPSPLQSKESPITDALPLPQSTSAGTSPSSQVAGGKDVARGSPLPSTPLQNKEKAIPQLQQPSSPSVTSSQKPQNPERREQPIVDTLRSPLRHVDSPAALLPLPPQPQNTPDKPASPVAAVSVSVSAMAIASRLNRDEPMTVAKVVAGGGGGGRVVEGRGRLEIGREENRAFRTLQWSVRLKEVSKAAVALRVATMALCMISFSVMAADKTEGWAGDSFDRYEEYR